MCAFLSVFGALQWHDFKFLITHFQNIRSIIGSNKIISVVYKYPMAHHFEHYAPACRDKWQSFWKIHFENMRQTFLECQLWNGFNHLKHANPFCCSCWTRKAIVIHSRNPNPEQNRFFFTGTEPKPIFYIKTM